MQTALGSGRPGGTRSKLFLFFFFFLPKNGSELFLDYDELLVAFGIFILAGFVRDWSFFFFF